MKRPDLSPLAPPGVNWAKEVRWTLTGIGISAAAGLLGFLFQLNEYCGSVRQMEEAGFSPVELAPFREILGGNLFCFILVNLSMAGLLFYHIDLHYRGSRSVYLMRRLPQRREFFRRCAGLPLAGLLCSLLTWGLLQLLLFWLYYILPPRHYLAEIYRSGFFTALLRGGF